MEQAVAAEGAVVKRKCAELRPQDDNPRTPNAAALAALAESLIRYGMEDGATCAWQPVIVNKHPDPELVDRVVGGEMRWRATQAAHIKEVWTREVVLDQAQMHELTVRLNVPAGEWDFDKLATLANAEQRSLWGVEHEFKVHDLIPKLVPIDVPVPDPSNARDHEERSIKAVATNLRRFGQRKPIVLRAGTNQIVAGEGTWLGARALGWSEIAVVYYRASDQDARDYALADNRSSEVSAWDLEQLSMQLRAIEEESTSKEAAAGVMESLGWKSHEAQPLLLADWAPPEIKPFDETAQAGGSRLMLKNEDKEAVQTALARARELMGVTLTDSQALRAICEEWMGERKA